MGSYNLVCSISGQIIQPSDTCLILPLTQASGLFPIELEDKTGKVSSVVPLAYSLNFPDAYWKSFGLLLKASYEDSGDTELFKDEDNVRSALAFFDYLLSKSLITVEGENMVHETRFDFKAFINDSAPLVSKALQDGLLIEESSLLGLSKQVALAWKYFLKSEKNSRVYVRGASGKPECVKLALISPIAFESLVGFVERGKDWFNDSKSQLTYVANVLGRFRADKLFDLESVEELYSSPSTREENVKLISRLFSLESPFRERLFKDGARYIAQEAYNTSKDVVEKWFTGQVSDTELFNAIKPKLDVVYLMWGLDQLGRFITPNAYGGQDYNNETGSQFSRFIREVEMYKTMSHSL